MPGEVLWIGEDGLVGFRFRMGWVWVWVWT